MIVIIDYGTGNIKSIANMLSRIGVRSVVSKDPADIKQADKLILPGVGSFDHGMEQLHKAGVVDVLNERVLGDKIPVLGICLGVQLLTASSEEGKMKGLGWVDGETVAFDRTKLAANQKVPHMGWREVHGFENSRLFTDMYEDPRFYFVHSFHLKIKSPAEVLVKSNYGYEFAAGIEKENIIGVQFHPEKSHKYGMKILENFSKHY